MTVRSLLIACALLWTLPAGGAGAQTDSPEKVASDSGRPVVSMPAAGDTASSVWITLAGAIPQDFVGKCREVQVIVNEASRGKAHLRGVNFSMEDLRLDCLEPGSWNTLRVVCVGPSFRSESDDVKVMFLPGPLEIETDLTSDAISPSSRGNEGGPQSTVLFRCKFSTPADWTFKITGGAEGTLVRAASGKDVSRSEFKWDGTDRSGVAVPDGEYMYEIFASSTCGDAGQAHYAGVIAVDTIVPGRPTPLDPVNNDIVSPNFSLRWEPVEGAWFYEVQLSQTADFDPHEIYSTGATQLRFSRRSDGTFKWRVRAVSRGGRPGPFSDARSAEVLKVMQPAISMLAVTTLADGMRPEKDEAMRVTYMANDGLVVTIRIVNASGKVVRTLLDGVARDKGPHVEMWDGRDDGNELVQAGAYIATVEAGGTEDVTPFRESRLVTVQY